jgi:signal transduction histidine kinase
VHDRRLIRAGDGCGILDPVPPRPSPRALLDLGRGGRPGRGQLAVTVLWLAGMYTTAAVRTGTLEFPGTALTVAVVGAWAPLLLRSWRPVLALLGALVAETLILVFLAVPDSLAATEGMGAYQPVPLATMLAVATLTARVPSRWGWWIGAVAGGYLALVGLSQRSSATSLTDLVLFYVVLTAAAVGVWRSGRRERAHRAAAQRAAETQEAVLDERLRIARELHDVLAHNLTLVNAQAGVAGYLLRTDAAAAERALADITAHTRRAIDDLRATIGLLRTADGTTADPGTEPGAGGPALRPVPGLADLDELVSRFTGAGARVDVARSGAPRPLSPQVDTAAYRIVQESLTNAAKHAPGTTIDLALTWSAEGLLVGVRNPVRADQHPGPGTGHGLIGMRERALSIGGSFRAGPTTDGRFEVLAALPDPLDDGDLT